MPPKGKSKAAAAPAITPPAASLFDLLRAVEAVDAGLLNLSSGVTETEAAALWDVYDENGDGELSKEEIGKLVLDLGGASMTKLEGTLEKVTTALSDPAASKAMFQSFDTSGDGKIDKEEFVKLAMKGVSLLGSIGLDEVAPSPKRPRRSTSAAVARAATEPTPGELPSVLEVLFRASAVKSGVEHLSDGVTKAEAEQMWSFFDADGSGEIDASELSSLFVKQAQVVVTFLEKEVASVKEALDNSEATVETVFKELDTSKDGKVQKSEFIALAKAGLKITG